MHRARRMLRPSPGEPQCKDSARTACAQVSPPPLTQDSPNPHPAHPGDRAGSTRGSQSGRHSRPPRSAFCVRLAPPPPSGPLLPLGPAAVHLSPQSWQPKPLPAAPNQVPASVPARPELLPSLRPAPALRLARRRSRTSGWQVGTRARGRRRHVCYGHVPLGTTKRERGRRRGGWPGLLTWLIPSSELNVVSE